VGTQNPVKGLSPSSNKHDILSKSRKLTKKVINNSLLS